MTERERNVFWVFLNGQNNKGCSRRSAEEYYGENKHICHLFVSEYKEIKMKNKQTNPSAIIPESWLS